MIIPIACDTFIMPEFTKPTTMTVVAEEGTLCDGLSTACYILGPEKGMDLAGQYGAEALFVMADGEIVMSEGMEQCFTEQ